MSYNKNLVKELKHLGKLLGEKNYTPGYSGNVSVRTKNGALITISGSANGFLEEDDFVEIDYEGNAIEPNRKPSSEKMLHLAFYKLRKDVNCVIHVHSTALSSFSASSKDLMEPVMIENVCYFGGIPLAEYGMPSSIDLVNETSKYFKDYCVVLMKNHGVIVGGSSIKDAFCKLEMAEEYAKSIIYANVLGGTSPLKKDDVDSLLKLMGKI